MEAVNSGDYNKENIMFQRILVPLDGSPRAEQALRVAARIARASGGSVMLLQVVSPPIDYAGGLTHTPLMMEQVIETELAISSGYLDRVAKACELAEIETTTKVMFGLPAQDILAIAELQSVDLIVMCSHGRTGFKRWVLGSPDMFAATFRDASHQKESHSMQVERKTDYGQ